MLDSDWVIGFTQPMKGWVWIFLQIVLRRLRIGGKIHRDPHSRVTMIINQSISL